MKDVLINAFVNAIKIGNMKLGQVPIPYQKEVEKRLNSIGEEEFKSKH